MDIVKERLWVKQELDRVTDFWLEHGMDKIYGGVYTCLDKDGEVFSTDKSVWMQGRCGWIFAYMCSSYGVKPQWLQASKSCLDFLENHCINHSAGGRLYFTVTKEGKPLRQRRYCYSEAFYCIANAEYYGVTGEREHLERARRAYDMYWQLNNGMKDPTGLGAKTEPETRRSRALGIPMIMLNMTSIMLRVDKEKAEYYNKIADECVRSILDFHVKKELGCTLESVAPDGRARLDISEGRVVNPGHDIECSWFLMERALDTGDSQLYSSAVEIFDMAFEKGWDGEYGGLLYFFDCLGNPPEAYEHDMKLWWPHNEALIASLMIYSVTGSEKHLEIFERVLDYCKNYFACAPCGEWYGYLRRDGRPTMPACIGSTFKGPFHVPRCLIMLDRMLANLEGGREDNE